MRWLVALAVGLLLPSLVQAHPTFCAPGRCSFELPTGCADTNVTQYEDATDSWICAASGGGGGDDITTPDEVFTDPVNPAFRDTTTVGVSSADLATDEITWDVLTVSGVTGANEDNLADDLPTALSNVTTINDADFCQGNVGGGFDCDVTQNAGTDITADLEEEGQIGAGVISGSLIDHAALVGTGANTASWTGAIPDCNTNNMLTFTQSTNTWGCDADDGAGGGTTIQVDGAGGEATMNIVSADSTGIDINLDTVASPDEIEINLDTTEVVGTTVWGGGASQTWQWNAGVTDPQIVFASDSITVSNAATFTVPNDSWSDAEVSDTLTCSLVVGAGSTTGAVDLGTAEVDGVLTGDHGGTANSFMQFSGPAATLKTYTLPNANSTILTTDAAVTVAQGGTGLTSGTSGGILGFTTSTTLASTAALGAGNIVVGGGAGAVPSSVAAGATTEILVGGGAATNPVWTTATGSGAPVRGTDPTIDAGGGFLEIPNGTAPVVSGAVGRIALDTNDSQLIVRNTADIVIPTRYKKCASIENLVAADEVVIWLDDDALTVTQGWCSCLGANCTTPAQFVFSDDVAGTDMTGTVTCSDYPTADTKTPITALNTLTALEPLVVDVTNTPTTDGQYILCFEATVTRE